jgi:hypothetical protein
MTVVRNMQKVKVLQTFNANMLIRLESAWIGTIEKRYSVQSNSRLILISLFDRLQSTLAIGCLMSKYGTIYRVLGNYILVVTYHGMMMALRNSSDDKVVAQKMVKLPLSLHGFFHESQHESTT